MIKQNGGERGGRRERERGKGRGREREREGREEINPGKKLTNKFSPFSSVDTSPKHTQHSISRIRFDTQLPGWFPSPPLAILRLPKPYT